MSTIQELASMEAGEKAEAQRALEEGIANEAAGRSVNVPRLRDAMTLLDLTAADFSKAVVERRELLRDIATGNTYPALLAEYKAASAAENEHKLEWDAIQAAATKKAADLAAASAHLRNEVQRVGAIHGRMVRLGHIAE